MRKLHDEIVGTAQASVNLSLDKHVEAYRRYLKSKNAQKFNDPDNAGLMVKS